MPDNDEIREEQQVDPSVAAVKEIADQFKESLSEFREARQDAGVPVQAAPAGPSPEEIAKQLVAEQEKVAEQCNELAAAGDFAAAAQHYRQFEQRVAQATAGDPADSPAYKALAAQAKREAKRADEKMFDKYGSEIEAEVNSMPVGDRINPDNWDEAIRRVKARHVDEIVQERLDAAAQERQEQRPRFTAPVAPGSRGNAGNTEVTDLDENQLAAAELLGYSPEKYAELIVAAEAKAIRRGMSRGMVELMDDDGPVEEGGF